MSVPSPSPYNDYGPITWIKRRPIYVSTLIAALLVVALVITTILASANVPVDDLFAFESFRFLHGWVWQLVTYPLLAQPDFFFLFGVVFFYFPAVEVEKYLGRRRFLTLLGLLVLYPPVIVCMWRTLLVAPVYAGNFDIIAGIFIAFATLYPNVEYWGTIPLKWIAFACLFISSLGHLPKHDWRGLLILWGLCAIAFGYIRFLKNGAEFPKVSALFRNLFRRRPKFKVVRSEPSPQEALHESIDPLLDKISRTGLSSLTPREKAQLQRARESLLKKPE